MNFRRSFMTTVYSLETMQGNKIKSGHITIWEMLKVGTSAAMQMIPPSPAQTLGLLLFLTNSLKNTKL